MRISTRSKLSLAFTFFALIVVITGLMAIGAMNGSIFKAHTARASGGGNRIDCSQGSPICTEVFDSEAVFGEGNYVGHDEPSTLFYSNAPGSGNQMRYQLTLPSDPSPSAPTTPGKSFNFQLHPAFWFGMAMCDTQSYPNRVPNCTPDSDTNIVDPAVSPDHPGTAFMEMQFYPPGWAPFANGGISCDPTKWCAALNIDSLSQNPVTGQSLNSACASSILGGTEYINFAFITLSGQSQGPANPIQSVTSPTSLVPDPTKDLFMNSGDKITVTLNDTLHGLRIDLRDHTTGQNGSMTASASNGFGQVLFAPTGTTCQNIPYDFHPMYSTSSEKTRVIWAAHSYNIAFSDEIGHFDFCNGTINTSFPFNCTGGTEGSGTDTEPNNGDDNFCLPASASLLVQVSGCTGTNTGFDGVPYHPVWPDGNTTLHPTSILFSSPSTGPGFSQNYSRVAFEADLPRVENPAVCNRFTGAGCQLIPTTDDPAIGGVGFEPAAFYPFFSIAIRGGHCVWQLGNHIPGSKNDFGQNAQYGTLLNLNYLLFGGGGAPTTRYNDFRNIMSKNPCQA